MPTLFFSDRDTLRLALASGGVPQAVTHAPAVAGHDEQGRLWLTTQAWLPKEALMTLSLFGVQIVGFKPPGPEKSVCCWQELIPLEREPIMGETAGGSVLFDLPGSRFASFAAQIDRLGRHPWFYCWADTVEGNTDNDHIWLKTVDPPYYVLMRALELREDNERDVKAYFERSPRVWIAADWRHPLAKQIHPPNGKRLCLQPVQAWAWREEKPFETAIDADGLSIAMQSRQRQIATSPPGQRLAVPLRLAPDHQRDEAELWLIGDEPMVWLERFVKTIDAKLLGHFTFAIAQNANGPRVLLRLRPSKEPPPVLVDLSAGFKPLLKLASVFIPCGTRLSPLLRRDTLSRFLADPERLTWLLPLDNGGFRAESLPLSGFRPLLSWVEHASEFARRQRRAWQQSRFGEMERFVEREPGLKPAAAAVTTSRPAARVSEERSGLARPAAAPRLWSLAKTLLKRIVRRPGQPDRSPEAATATPAETVTSQGKRLPSEQTFAPKAAKSSQRAKVLEARFLSMLTNLTPRERLELWPDMATAYLDANNPADAAVCWLNALWEEEKLSPAWTWRWFKAEAAQAGWDANIIQIADWLASPPTAASARAVAAYIVWAGRQERPPAGFRANLDQLQRYFDDQEENLPVRAAWLGRTALVRIRRGDVLALAHTRDRVFQRLAANGMALDVDAPAFIRFAESGDPDRYSRVRTWLADKSDKIRSWIENLAPPQTVDDTQRVSLDQFGLQAEIACTAAYADLLLAWGLSRLGEKNEAAALRNRAWAALDDRDPIHSFLKSSLDFRIRQSREGRAVGARLPAELMERLESMPADDRYRIDRFRQHSHILGPSERVNAYWASTFRTYRHWDQLHKRLIDLPALDGAMLNDRVAELLSQAAGDGAAMSRILLEVLDVTNRLGPLLADKVLAAVAPALDLVSETASLELKLLEKGLLAAASCSRPAVVQELAGHFVRYVKRQRGLPSAARLEGLTRETFRCFRRLGLKKDAYEILKQIDASLTDGEDLASLKTKRPKEWPSLLRTLLPVAAAYYYSGQQTPGFAIIDRASQELYSGSMSLSDRTALALVYAATLGQVPVGMALGRFDDLFNRLKTVAVNGWNTHYTLQPLELIDTVVLAVVSDDFILGPSVRAWLDDEEFLVRQRIQKELGKMMEEHGV